MKKLIIKYVIIAIIVFALAKLITAALLMQWPDLLTTYFPNGNIESYGRIVVERGLTYLFNIVVVTILFKDMKKYNLINIPILILTFLTNFIGILLFLLIAAFPILTIKTQPHEWNY